MKVLTSLALLFSLVTAPVMAGLIQVQEIDEAASCELRAAGMVTPAPENGALFPHDDSCAVGEIDSRDDTPRQGAIEIAGYSPSADR